MFRASLSADGGFSYSLSFELRFLNSLSSQATILSQVQGAVDYYASQASAIQSTIAASFSDYRNAPIDAATLKSSIQITQPGTTTTTKKPSVGYTASLANVLVMQSTTEIYPNIVFGSLSNLVKFNFHLEEVLFFFYNFYIRLDWRLDSMSFQS